MAVYPKSVIMSVFKVEALLGRVWKDPNLLAEALCHPSFRSDGKFERFAFFGERVLYSCFGNHLYDTHPRFKAVHMTRIAADNACLENYARRAVKSGLYQYLHHHSASLGVHVDKYTCSLMMEGCMEPATEALGEMLQAIAAALHQDCGGNGTEVLRVFEPILLPLIIKPHHLIRPALRNMSRPCFKTLEEWR